jgi:iron(III) transport system substrate-binding protein
MRFSKLALAALFAVSSTGLVQAADTELNLYSSRHYQTDEKLYADFTAATGIKINRIEADDAGLLARLKAEGSASPADVIMMVDAARLWRAENAGLFQPIKSAVLEERIPASLRDKNNHWFGFSTRARVIVYNKVKVDRDTVQTYESLADPKLKGKLCTISGAQPYNVSLFGSMLEHNGEAKTEAILAGMAANMARSPVGGDIDQVKAVGTGECGVALSNSYYVARMFLSTHPDDRNLMNKVGIVWPDQQTNGTHVNIAGAGVAKNAPHKEAAVKFLEYLASDKAQRYFADANNEWPVVKSVVIDNPALKRMGGNSFKTELINVAVIGGNQQKVLNILDRVGYK